MIYALVAMILTRINSWRKLRKSNASLQSLINVNRTSEMQEFSGLPVA